MPAMTDDTVYAVFGQVIRCHYRRMHVLLDRLGVYPGQPPLLFVLGACGALSQKELAQKLQLKPSTITVMLNRMARARLIRRRPDPADHRITKVHLTGRGRQVRDRVRETLRAIEAECFDGFTAVEQRRLRAMLLKMKDNLSAAAALHRP